MNWRRSIATCTVILGLCGAACGESDDPSTDAGATETSMLGCMAPDGEVYRDGLPHELGDGLVVELRLSDPAPPELGSNTWTMLVLQDDVAIAGLELVARPFMPAHGHGTTPATTTATLDGDVYSLENMDLFMPGLWQVAITIDGVVDGTTIDAETTYSFCIEG